METKWDKFFDEKVRLLAEKKKILDAGGGNPFQKHMAKYKELFKNSEVVVLDKHMEGEGVVKGDIHELPFVDASFDAFICKSVLEHVEDPVKAVSELNRVLKKGGLGYVYVPFLFPYHADKGVYQDFWRFTEDGVRYLFRGFSKIEIQRVRGFLETVLYFLPYIGKFLAVPARFVDSVVPNKNQTSGFNIFLVK